MILFFTGWSSSPGSFRQLEIPDDTDLWVCFDYRDLTFKEDLTSYRHVHLVAWSLGVWVADHLFSGKQSFETATAINGTPDPIHDQHGIPRVIFEGTLAHITEEGMSRFNRRMCGDRETLAAYSRIPIRPLDLLREELRYLYDGIERERVIPIERTVSPLWSRVLICTGDKIFPADNLRRYWQGKASVKELTAAHFPFYHIKSWDELWK